METDSPAQVSLRAAAASTEVDRKLSHAPFISSQPPDRINRQKALWLHWTALQKEKKSSKPGQSQEQAPLFSSPSPFLSPNLLSHIAPSPSAVPKVLLNIATISRRTKSPQLADQLSFSVFVLPGTFFLPPPDFGHCPSVCLWADPWLVPEKRVRRNRKATQQQANSTAALLTQRQKSLASFPFNIQV